MSRTSKVYVKSSSNGGNTDGTSMNVGNKMSERPSIRLHKGKDNGENMRLALMGIPDDSEQQNSFYGMRATLEPREAVVDTRDASLALQEEEYLRLQTSLTNMHVSQAIRACEKPRTISGANLRAVEPPKPRTRSHSRSKLKRSIVKTPGAVATTFSPKARNKGPPARSRGDSHWEYEQREHKAKEDKIAHSVVDGLTMDDTRSSSLPVEYTPTHPLTGEAMQLNEQYIASKPNYPLPPPQPTAPQPPLPVGNARSSLNNSIHRPTTLPYIDTRSILQQGYTTLSKSSRGCTCACPSCEQIATSCHCTAISHQQNSLHDTTLSQSTLTLTTMTEIESCMSELYELPASIKFSYHR